MAFVLVVEDTLSQGRRLQRLLEADGHQATVVTSSKEAFKHLASNNPVDLVLCDLRLPDVDGVTLFRMLRGRLDAVPPFVIVTGFSTARVSAREQLGYAEPFDDVEPARIDVDSFDRLDDEQLELVLRAGIYDCLSKPVRPDHLRALVSRLAA